MRLIGLSTNPSDPSLKSLADVWEQTYLPEAKPAIASMLKALCQDMRATGANYEAIKAQVNAQLLQAAASETLELQVAGGTSSGPAKARNERCLLPQPSRNAADRDG